jgi:hypothetical protein
VCIEPTVCRNISQLTLTVGLDGVQVHKTVEPDRCINSQLSVSSILSVSRLGHTIGCITLMFMYCSASPCAAISRFTSLFVSVVGGGGGGGGGTREQCDGAGEACDSLPSDLGQHKEYVWVLVNECRNVTCHTSRTLGHLRTFYEYAVSSEDESVMGASRYVVDLWRLKKRRCEVATCYFALCSFR